MDLEIVLLSEVRQRKTNTNDTVICGILISGTNELSYKTEIESQM